MKPSYTLAALLCFGVTISVCFAQDAGEHAHDHSVAAPSAMPAAGMESISGHGEAFDLTIVYPPFHAGDAVSLRLMVADWDSNEPVENAEIELTMTGPDVRRVLPVEAIGEPGHYRASIGSVGNDTYSFLAEITRDGDYDLISVSRFEPATEHHDAPTGATSFDLQWYGVFLLAAVAVVAGLVGFSIGASTNRRANLEPSSSMEEELK